MQRFKWFYITFLALLLLGFYAFTPGENQPGNILSYTVNTKTQNLKLYWKDEKGESFKSIQNLKAWLESKKLKLVFAMNGGMYKKDNSPQGLFIENFETKASIDTSSGNGNFYLKPNGVFYISDKDEPFICRTHDFKNTDKIKYATQSGPMLLINGQINPQFKEGSKNLNIRNGVGVLSDGKVVFAMSKSEINFYDFANYFKSLGCKNALYLDGFVSRTYLPEQKCMQTDGDFGVLIGVTEKLN
jgi:uncharacterized protein YigE (DUF2233 family)